MFERFTDRARRVVVLAQEEARDLGHNYIGTEHILLGLLREREGVAARALESLGISLDVARQRVEEIIGTGGGMPTGHIPFTPRAKKVLELSLREALQLGHNYIGTEHILLGLVREGDGVGAQVLVGLGADLITVRREVVSLVHGEPEQLDVAGETPVAQAFRPGRTPRSGTPVRVAGPPFRPGPSIQAESIAARIGEVVSRLDVIAERLAVIERLLVEGKRPAAPRKPPAARKPKPPPAKPPAGGAEPPAGGEAQG
jgi:ATP-dependent Clp protease ATP-binding subunit ClpC